MSDVTFWVWFALCAGGFGYLLAIAVLAIRDGRKAEREMKARADHERLKETICEAVVEAVHRTKGV